MFLIVILCLCAMTSLFAQDYRITDFRMDITADASNTLHVIEDLDFQFDGPHHGFYQEIPVRFGKKRVILSNLKASEPLTEDKVSSDWVTYRVGYADRTVQGTHSYTLSYDYAIGDDGNNEYDEVYYNLLGTGWECAVDNFSFTLHMDKPVDSSRIWVTRGVYGSTEKETVSVSADGKTISGRYKNLGNGEGLTIRVELPQGYFSEVRPYVDMTLLYAILCMIASIATMVLAYFLFNKYGRDKVLVPVVRYTPPEGLSPLEVGFLADGVVDPKDLTSMLFYWADQGCLTIEQVTKKKMVFTKIKEPGTSKIHELKFFDAFFACGTDGVVEMKDLNTEGFARAVERAKSDTLSYFTKARSLVDQKAERKKLLVFLLTVVPLLFSAFASTWDYLAGITVAVLGLGIADCVITTAIFSHLMSHWEMKKSTSRFFSFFAMGIINLVFVAICWVLISEAGRGGFSFLLALCATVVPAIISSLGSLTGRRSDYGVKVMEQTLGYREFISKVEMDKLKLMIDEDPQIFYHVLGYAIVLGLEEKWAKKFAKLAMVQPSWYVGPSNLMFDYLFFSALTRNIQTSVVQNLYHEASSGRMHSVGSSFGGGGFSGGGFGGGGGGAW